MAHAFVSPVGLAEIVTKSDVPMIATTMACAIASLEHVCAMKVMKEMTAPSRLALTIAPTMAIVWKMQGASVMLDLVVLIVAVPFAPTIALKSWTRVGV